VPHRQALSPDQWIQGANRFLLGWDDDSRIFTDEQRQFFWAK